MRVSSSWLVVSLLSVAALASEGCGHGCTTIGCGSPLILAVRNAGGDPVVGYTVRVSSYGRTWMASCPTASGADGGRGCTDGTVDISDPATTTQPEATATIEIHTDDGRTWSGALASLHETFRPNGPDCEPVCFRGPITFTFAQ